MKKYGITRREALENCIVRGGLLAAAPMAATTLFADWARAEKRALKPTSTEVLGPFYKKGAPNESAMRIVEEPGMALRVSGSVTDERGEPVAGAHVALWHTDHYGRYDVMGYRYRAELVVGESADYSVDTIMPGHYPTRPAQHIHYLITAPGYKSLITQAYFATDPWFEGDPEKNFGRIAKNRELVRPVTLFEQREEALNGKLPLKPGEASAAITFDIRLEKA